MLNGPFALALTAGMAATVNPCGFALLPAYLSAFVGLDDSTARTTAVARGLKVSVVLTAGFITVFGIFGLVISGVASELQRYLPWATIVIGIGLVGLGIYLLTGRQIVLNIPKLQKGGSDGTLLSMFLFGVSYAVASLSCTIGPFLAVTSTTFRNENYLSGVMVFVLYGLGMGLVVSVLTMAVALAKDGMVARFRSLLPKMNMIAGVLLVVAGLYVAYYGYYEVRLFFFDGALDDPVIDAGERVQSWLQGLMPDTGNYWQWVIGAVVLLAAGIGWTAYRTRRRADAEPVAIDEPADVETV
ncbi:MAG: cytochrome c biogenesis protein CcdA [Ilumatobacter sp.]|nr:cytochrome c biogenesis protein CcdA [Ilumatobacter sp.]